MKTATIVWVLVALLVVGGGWYWYSSMAAKAPSGGPSTPPQGDGTAVGNNLILGTQTSATLGKFLSAYNGMTLYTFASDSKGVSNCSGTCATNWPPYTVASASDINLSAAIAGKISTITRADGTLQITYNGTPLYFYIKDKKPGDTTGQGVGGVWFVVKQ